MIFLADIETDGPRYKRTKDTKKEVVPSKKTKSKASKKNKKKLTKQKKSAFTKLVNKTAGVASFTEGEMAIVKSRIANDVKTPLNNQKDKQKTIGAKKSIDVHRTM